ncbi:hypothetical protein KDK95_11705 [Actinospica sp. MGRD01-02]|uniref:GCVT N-terminal domain-containing protein n=1 Tax=Actinospica acidithermotolerans TaxID=2828514 RepID=A0A941E8F2_9ACTN|nr:hypothetical protein [Actinospica acidithermotolerans]MBR7826971.1 hypothetical protein [Actinospica acidithermotolerans]
MDNGARQRQTYEDVVRHREAPFVVQRPPLFSPAAAAQDEANPRGAFGHFAQIMLPLEYTGWVDECRAHTSTCYLGDWTSLNKILVRGPQALEFLSWLGMNDLTRFALGQVKHHVQLDGNGWIASEGVLCRLGEEEFLYTAGSGDWLVWQFSQDRWDAEVEDVSPDRFIFGVQGPASLFALEKAVGAGLRDIAFNRSREAEIEGMPVRVLRTGISGELGYEVHGRSADANEVWSAIADAGAEFGIRRLGLRSQPVQHIEAGIATNGLDYLPSAILTPGAPRQFRRGEIGGSFAPTAVSDYFRKPSELGWGRRGATASHEFLGRDAVVADSAEGGGRKLMGLVWNVEDVASVLTSVLGEAEIPDQMELPRQPGPSFDQVLAAGRPVGVSSGRTLSAGLRSMISLCVIDAEHAAAGTAVTVLWGRPGTPQREIRATVTELPFKPDHRRLDVGNLSAG